MHIGPSHPSKKGYDFDSLSRVQRRAGADILEVRVVDGLGEESIARLVPARERDTGRAGRAATGNLDLEASDVGLGLASSGVECDGLGADEVVARCQALGDSEGSLSAVGVEDFGSP